jgi:hypothetical protein
MPGWRSQRCFMRSHKRQAQPTWPGGTGQLSCARGALLMATVLWQPDYIRLQPTWQSTALMWQLAATALVTTHYVKLVIKICRV